MDPTIKKTPTAVDDASRRYYGFVRLGVWVIFLATPILIGIAVRMLLLRPAGMSATTLTISLLLSSRAAFWLRNVLRETEGRLARVLAVCGYAVLAAAVLFAASALYGSTSS